MKKFTILSFLFLITFTTLTYGNCETKFLDNTVLYPASDPYDEGYLQVSNIHSIYYAQFGNPEGLPVLVVHGGPGGGCFPSWSSFFDPSFYRVIMFDQRGAYRSKPPADMRENTPQLLVEDMETIRKHLGINQWVLFGGSWGSALSILYGETHPDRALGFILRGIFLARKMDYEHLFYGMRNTFPEAWDEMLETIPPEERGDLIQALHKRVMNPDPNIHMPVAHAFMRYDTICGTLLPNDSLVQEQADDNLSTICVGRAFVHYSANNFFLTENQLLENLNRISHLPAILVHGRYDTICLPQSAYELYKKWPGSQLWWIPDAGHFSLEPSIGRGLKEAMDSMKIIITNELQRINE